MSVDEATFNGGNLMLDFASHRYEGNPNDPVFETGLDDQYKKTQISKEYGPFDDFIRDVFLNKSDITLLFSNPNFIRNGPRNDNRDNQYYDNIAIRCKVSDNIDVILSGNIALYSGDANNRVVKIKGISIVDSKMIHHGEITVKCRIYARIQKNGSEQWEDCSGAYPWVGREMANNLLTNDFIEILEKEYVVKDPDYVIGVFDNWMKYLDSRLHKIECDGKNGLELDSADLLIAYHDESDDALDAIDAVPNLEPQNGRWSLKLIPGSNGSLLLHTSIRKHHNPDETTDGRKSHDQKEFDAFTKEPIILVVNGDEKNSIRTGDTRISPSYCEFIQPDEEIRTIENERLENRKRAERLIEKKRKDEAAYCADEYLKNEAPGIIATFRNDQTPIESNLIRKRLNADYSKELSECENAIKSLEDKIASFDKKDQKEIKKCNDALNVKNREYANLRDKYDIEAAIEQELRKRLDFICSEEEKRLHSAKFNEIYESSGPRFVAELDRERESIDDVSEEKKRIAIHDHTDARYHVYFELFVPDTSNLIEELKTNTKILESGTPKLHKDSTGDKTKLKRERKALELFMKGAVSNPFLATALFSPGSMPGDIASEDVMFEQQFLNKNQKDVVRRAIASNGLFLIQGPPGTGKTQVIDEITIQEVKKGKKVLIASENNKAVDNAFGRLPKRPYVRPLRIISRSGKTEDNPYLKDNLLSNFYKNVEKTLSDNIRRMGAIGDFEKRVTESIGEIKKLENELDGEKESVSSLRDAVDDKKRIRDSKLEQMAKLQNEIKEKEFELQESKGFLEKAIQIEVSELPDELIDRISRIADVGNAIRFLSECSEDEITADYLISIEHPELISILCEGTQNEKADLYSKKHHISLESLNLWKIFGRNITEDILDFKSEIDATIEVKKSKDLLNSKTLGVMIQRKQKSLETTESEIESIQYEIDSLISSDDYSHVESLQDNIRNKVIDLYGELKITDSLGDIPSALVRINEEMKRIKERFTNNKDVISRYSDAYGDIAEYLSSESLIEADSVRYNDELLKHVNVIGLTCTMRYDARKEDDDITPKKLGVDVVIIDEVSKIPFVELIQPILYGKTVILVGDHRQLPPIFDRIDAKDLSKYDSVQINKENEDEYERMCSESFFAKLFKDTPVSNKMTLNIQYRMHPDIMDADNVFYDGKLQFGGDVASKNHRLTILGKGGKKIITPDNHLVFIDCKGSERHESGSTSIYNEAEIDVVESLLYKINANCKTDRDGNPISNRIEGDDRRLSVGVICAYKDQARRIKKRIVKGRFSSFNAGDDEKFMIKTVDDFQGDERDVIILSLVRTTDKSSFLQDYRRINVAMSRARRLLIIVGNGDTLRRMKVDIDDDNSNKNPKRAYREIIDMATRKGGSLNQYDILGGE